MFLIGYTVLYGVAWSEIDIAPHVGGLLTGFAVGLVSLGSQANPSPRVAMRRTAAAAVAAVAILAGGVWLLPKPDDAHPDIAHFVQVEGSTLAAFNTAIDQWKSSRVQSDEVLRVIEQDVRPKWRAERNVLARPRLLSPRQQEITAALVEYIDAREASWALLADGIRRDDVAIVRSASEKMREADRLAQSIGGPGKQP